MVTKNSTHPFLSFKLIRINWLSLFKLSRKLMYAKLNLSKRKTIKNYWVSLKQRVSNRSDEINQYKTMSQRRITWFYYQWKILSLKTQIKTRSNKRSTKCSYPTLNHPRPSLFEVNHTIFNFHHLLFSCLQFFLMILNKKKSK